MRHVMGLSSFRKRCCRCGDGTAVPRCAVVSGHAALNPVSARLPFSVDGAGSSGGNLLVFAGRPRYALRMDRREILAGCRLYGIVDMGYVSPDHAEEAAAALIRGGVRILQLRAKGMPEEDVRMLAYRLQPLCCEAGCLFIVNDYPEIAMECGADGVHVGQDDGALKEVRKMIGEGMLVGRSTHSPEQALAAHAEGADYIGFGPLFPTGTKPGRPAIGLDDVCRVGEALGDYPVFCIGGINGGSLDRVLEHGARRVVIVSWLLLHEDPAGAARDVIQKLEGR